MYTISRTPKPPINSHCSLGGEHEPAELIGSSFERMALRIRTDDGGEVCMAPCRRCGLMYWTAEKGVWKGRA